MPIGVVDVLDLILSIKPTLNARSLALVSDGPTGASMIRRCPQG
ncbi:hypothetical protein ACSSV4_004302 [Roseovarius sp. MBR-154]|jgi:hypothetical protein